MKAKLEKTGHEEIDELLDADLMAKEKSMGATLRAAVRAHLRSQREAALRRSRAEKEKVLVVREDILFSFSSFEGVKPVDMSRYEEIIKEHGFFVERAKAEKMFGYKQIIPYIVFKADDFLFVAKRSPRSTEQRLKNRYTIGMGGHIKEEDLKAGDTIFDWAKREIDEELKNVGEISLVEPIGIVNENEHEVSRVHVGFVYVVHGSNTEMEVTKEHVEGRMFTYEECNQVYRQMEPWSRLVFDLIYYRETGAKERFRTRFEREPAIQ